MGEGPTAQRQLRVIGPDDPGGTITTRCGGRLGIVFASRPGGWSMTSYPHRVLRIAGSARPSDSHTFHTARLATRTAANTPQAPAGPRVDVGRAADVRIAVVFVGEDAA